MLSGFKDNLLIIPITLDMTLISMLSDQNNLKQKLHDACIEYCDYMQQESMRNELRLLARQWMNISYQETLKIACYAYVLFISMRHSILALSTRDNEMSWNKVYIEIDRSNNKLNSREKIIFSKMLGMWFESWSRKEPFTFIKQIHDQHVLVKNCDSQDGQNQEELIHDEIIKYINWGDSKDSWGLQVADIASSIVYSAANDLENQKGSFAPFCKLMELSSYGYLDGPGLFSPLPMSQEVSNIFSSKYKNLSEVLRLNGFKANYYGQISDRLDLK